MYSNITSNPRDERSTNEHTAMRRSASTTDKNLQMEKPTFLLNDVRLLFAVSNKIEGLSLANDVAYIILPDRIHKFSLEEPSKVVTVLIPKQFTGSKITGYWSHPCGKHLVVQLSSYVHLYLHDTYQNFKVLSKFNGLKTKDITFRTGINDSERVELLLITTDNYAYVAYLKPHFASKGEGRRDDKYLKQVLRSDKELICACISTRENCVYMVTASETIYWHVTLKQDLLYNILQSSSQRTPHLEITKEYRLYSDTNDYYIISSLSSILTNNPEALLKSSTRSFDQIFVDVSQFAATPHHYVMINMSGNVIIQDKLFTHAPFQVNCLPGLPILGMNIDPINGTIWMYSSNNIHELISPNEAISVWLGYYRMGRFDEAYLLLESLPQRPEIKLHKNAVTIKKGYSLLQQGGFGVDLSSETNMLDLFDLQCRGIVVLAQLMEPFEKVCLMLLGTRNQPSVNSRNEELLIAYLHEKLLHAIDQSNGTKTTALTSWLVFLYAKRIKSLLDYLTSSSTKITKLLENYDDPTKRLDHFLESYHRYMNYGTIAEVLSKLHLDSASLHLATLEGKFDFILEYHIEKQNWNEANITVRNALKADENAGKELLYCNAPTLLKHCPELTIDTWLHFSTLDVRKLLPTILEYNKQYENLPLSENHAMSFLSKLIHGLANIDCHVLNSYIALLVRYPDDDLKQSTRSLTNMLNLARDNKRLACYDAQLILRLALKYKKIWPAAIIMINDMKLYESSLQLALSHDDVLLAEFVLRRYEQDLPGKTNAATENYSSQNVEGRKIQFLTGEDEYQTIKKRLWSTYAAFLMSHPVSSLKLQGSILGNSMRDKPKLQHILRYLLDFAEEVSPTRSPLDIKCLLPLLPKSVEIAELREEIVESLDQYNDFISLLTIEMRELVQICSKLRSQIQSCHNLQHSGQTGILIEAGEACSLCSKLLLEKNIVVFSNCQHGFHKECIARYHLNQRGEYRFKELFHRFRQHDVKLDRSELDSMFHRQCVLCHDVNIGLIDEELLNGEKDRQQKLAWAL